MFNPYLCVLLLLQSPEVVFLNYLSATFFFSLVPLAAKCVKKVCFGGVVLYTIERKKASIVFL